MLLDRFAIRPLRCKTAIAVGLLFSVLPAHAVTYDTQDATTTHSAELRVEANFSKKWHNGLSLTLGEEMRFPMGGVINPAGTSFGPSFGKSYTSIKLGYRPIQYFKVDAGYTLRIFGNKDWNYVNKWLRHRVFLTLTGNYHYERWSFTLRERFISDIRMGSIDQHTATGLYEKNRADWQLRSRIGVAYHVFGKPVKPYLWVELDNTLNANELSGGQQYISAVRAQAGTTWRLTKQNALNFFYRFTYGYDKDVNVKPNKQTIHLTEETRFQHVIGITYNFDW